MKKREPTNCGPARARKLEKLLKRVGSEFSDHTSVYPILNQHNTRVLEIFKPGNCGSVGMSCSFPFDVMENATEKTVRERIAETCKERIEWLSDLKERSN